MTMPFGSAKRLFTLKQGITVRLKNLTDERWNVTIYAFVGRCQDEDTTDAKILAHEVSWDKAKPEFHSLAQQGGPIVIEVKRSNIQSAQVLEGDETQWPDDIMRHHLQVIDGELEAAVETLSQPAFESGAKQGVVWAMAQSIEGHIKQARAVILGITK